MLTEERLDDLVPIEPARMEDRQIIEWDKDDIDVLKFMKVDVLGLGMLGCMNRAFNLLREHKAVDVGMADLQDDDPAVYGMIQKADTLGVFQIESRAQMSMLPRISFEGTLTTLLVTAPIAIVPNGRKVKDNEPDFRVIARKNGYEVGAGWTPDNWSNSSCSIRAWSNPSGPDRLRFTRRALFGLAAISAASRSSSAACNAS